MGKAMTIRIDGGTVVGWSGTHHELIPEGSLFTAVRRKANAEN